MDMGGRAAGATSEGRRERKKRETRERILLAATDLFRRRGFEATTVEEIAEAADISRATLFNYFPHKAALVSELGDALFANFQRGVEAARALPLSTPERLLELFRGSAQRLLANPSYSRALLVETTARRRDFDERKDRVSGLHDAFREILEDGVRQGDVAPGANLSLLAAVIAGAYTEVLLTWLVEPDLPVADRLCETAQLLASMLAPKRAADSETTRTPKSKTRQA